MELLNLMNSLNLTQKDSDRSFFKTIATDINGVATEIVLAEYTHKTTLIASQYNNVGSMVVIEKAQLEGPEGSNQNIYTTKVVFGCSTEEEQVAARYLTEAIDIKKQLYLFMNLKSYDNETVKMCKDIIVDLLKTKD